MYEYRAVNGDELNFREGDRLSIVRKGDDQENEWWWAKNGLDKEGYVPRNLLGVSL